MNERAITFGESESLAGVLTEMETDPRFPHVLILNAGMIHHVGPGRLGVEIARLLAAEGYSSLRFDFSGIGDSAPRVPALDPIACGIADVRDAMDHLGTAHGVRRFILLGLCSGARHAHYVATADSRVVGVVLLDGYAFPTIRSKLMSLKTRLDHPLELIAGVNRRINRILHSNPSPKSRLPDDDGGTFFPKDPTRDEMATALQSLAARDVKLLCIFSGEWQNYRYEGQFQDAFRELDFGSNLTERLLDSADHLYFTRPERTAMMTMVTSWIREHFC